MIKKALIGCFFLLISFFSLSLSASEDSSFLDSLNSDVLKTIANLEPPLEASPNDFSSLKEGLLKNWESLFKNGHRKIKGFDKDIRPYFVGIQAIIEEILASSLGHTIKFATAFIHTPMPATPLCTKGEISSQLVDPVIKSDPFRLFTVKTRANTLRNYLKKGGYLYVVYPENGLKKRTLEEQLIYKEEIQNYKTHLFNTPLHCEKVPEELIGATYFFTDALDKTFVFSIQISQAKEIQNISTYVLWLSDIKNPLIQKRLEALFEYFSQNNFTPNDSFF